MSVPLSIGCALLLIAAIVLMEVKRAVDLRDFWERDEHEDGGP